MSPKGDLGHFRAFLLQQSLFVLGTQAGPGSEGALRYLMNHHDMSYHQTIVEELPHTLEAARRSLTFNQGTGSILYILFIYVDKVLGLAEGLQDKSGKPRAKEGRRK